MYKNFETNILQDIRMKISHVKMFSVINQIQIKAVNTH